MELKLCTHAQMVLDSNDSLDPPNMEARFVNAAFNASGYCSRSIVLVLISVKQGKMTVTDVKFFITIILKYQ